jgi:hypothetical protein
VGSTRRGCCGEGRIADSRGHGDWWREAATHSYKHMKSHVKVSVDWLVGEGGRRVPCPKVLGPNDRPYRRPSGTRTIRRAIGSH